LDVQPAGQPFGAALQQILGQVVQKAGGLGFLIAAVGAAPALRAGEGQRFLGAGNAHVQQAAFLGQRFGVVARAAVRQYHLIQPDNEYVFELQTLGSVQGQQSRGVQRFRQCVLVGHQRHRFQKAGQPVVLQDDLAQFHHVLPAVLPFFAAVVDVFLVAGIFQNAVEKRRGRVPGRVLPPEQQLFAELFQAQTFLAKLLQRGSACRLSKARDGFAQGQVSRAGVFFQLFQALAANAARGQVDNPPQADFIPGIVNQTQEGNHILHLAPSVKALSADQSVAEALAPEGFLQQARLSVGAVHHGKGAGVLLLGADSVLHGLHDVFGFLFVIRGGEQLDFLALPLLGKQLFARAVGVAVNHRHGSVQDALGRAVVLFQQNGLGVLEVALKALDVAIIRAAPAVDRLVFIANHIQIAVLLRQAAQNGILGEVGILKFVHQNVLEFMRPGAARLRIGAQELVGEDQHVVKVHGIIADQQLLVAQVKLTHFFVPKILDGIVFGANQVVFRAGYCVQYGFCPEQFLVHPGFADDLFHQGHLVVCVEDDKILAQRQQVGFPAQYTSANGMKGAQPDARGCRAQDFFHARRHFFGSLVGKGDREDMVRRHMQHANQIGDAVGQHARLAGARTSQHQRRPSRGSHGALLLGVEQFK